MKTHGIINTIQTRRTMKQQATRRIIWTRVRRGAGVGEGVGEGVGVGVGVDGSPEIQVCVTLQFLF